MVRGLSSGRAWLLAIPIVLATLTTPARARGLTLAADGQARLPIVLAEDATGAERTAATELARYLELISSARFDVVSEGPGWKAQPGIYVGPTAFASRADCDVRSLGPEESLIRTVGESLVLAGGRPRGTLYAVFRFLENQQGVRWWNPFEETVPRRRRPRVRSLDERSEPAFGYRDVGSSLGPPSFYARNRMNGSLARLSAAWGGCESYAPPHPVHNFFDYVPPDQYFESHPEYYSEVDGQRRWFGGQLCLTNEDLVELLAGAIETAIDEARAQARLAGEEAPRLIGFSANDWGGACGCESCSAVVERTGSPSGPLVEIVNRLAERLSVGYPDVLLDTLAYHFTFRPPVGIELRDNVVVRLSALQRRDFTRPVEDLFHREYREAIDGWSAITRHLRIWEYAVTFGGWDDPFHADLPLPNLRPLAADFRYFLRHGVEGLYIQQDHFIGSDMRDLKLWVMLKLMEEPSRDYDELLREFTSGFYGPAGRFVRRYLERLESAVAETPTRIGYPTRPEDYRYLDARFVVEAQQLFDRAERSVAQQPTLLRRVRHARLSLDRATLLRWPVLAAGRPVAGLERLDPWRIARRYRRTWHEETELRARAGEQAWLLDEVGREIERALSAIER